MMESFKLKIEQRNKLYYNKFEYKAVCRILGAAFTYYVHDLETFVSRLEKLKTSRNRYGVRTIDDDWKSYIEEVDIDQISRFLAWRSLVKKEKCLYRISGDSVSFFSNSLDLLKTLESIDPNVTFSQAIQLDPDIMYFRNEPKHKFRTFFKGKRAPEDFFKNILDFQANYKSLNVCKSLLLLAENRKSTFSRYAYLHGSYFVDYDEESMLSILHMFFPTMVAKTYRLAKRQ